jgi:hypothetical protein
MIESMLDAFFALEEQVKPPEFGSSYTADQAIVGMQYIHVPHSDELTIVFPPWHAPQWFTRHIKQQLLHERTNALIYDFNPLLLSKDVLKVKNSFEYIAQHIHEDVKKVQASRPIRAINLLGLSIGNVALCFTAETLSKFDHITLVVPENDLALSIWDGWRTRRLRNILKAEGYKLAKLQQEWIDLAPLSHIQTLKNHPVKIILSKDDHLIQHRHGKELFDKLHQLNSETTCHISPFGHIATLLRYTMES